VTAANIPDVTMLAAVVDDIPPIRGLSGRRPARPDKLDADKGYDSRTNRAYLRRRGITARIARRGIESSTRLGRHRRSETTSYAFRLVTKVTKVRAVLPTFPVTSQQPSVGKVTPLAWKPVSP
jgi:hypothetical protein